MPAIDSDSHVIETGLTWNYLSEKHKRFRPRVVTAEAEGNTGKPESFWVIDGEMVGIRAFDPERTGTPLGARELENVDLRLKHMDELGVDIHILYPTAALGLFAWARRETQIALLCAYNRWVADVSSRGKGRLRWIVAPPVIDMAMAIDEMRFGKEHGACGVLMHGIVNDVPCTDPYYFPLYQEAQRLDMPVCFHAGEGSPGLRRMLHSRTDIFWRSKMPVIAAFHGLVRGNIPAKFPTLRWGFIEANASWVPYLLHDLGAFAYMLEPDMQSTRPRALGANLITDSRFYVTCEVHDDLPYVLRYAGEDNLLIGSDYGHADPSSVLTALNILKRRGESGDVSPQAVHKILDENARAFYGI